MLRGPKIVFIIGTTGVGKSKLGIELAQRFKGEVISADSIQVYDHLDIGSAKVTHQEAQGVVHHLISCIPCTKSDFSVTEFLPMAREKLSQVTMPIVVGGTFYYVESLLWKSFMSMKDAVGVPAREAEHDQQQQDDVGDEIMNVASLDEVKFDGFTTVSARKKLIGSLKQRFEVHEILKRVDEVMAKRFHPNNVRKIERSLEVWADTGNKHSDLILECRGDAEDDGEFVAELFYEDICILWLDAQKEAIEGRIESRVDKMVQQGLIPEVEDLYKIIKGQPTSCGIGQSIGYKEFLPYLELERKNDEADDKFEERKAAVLNDCLETLKRATRKYAKRQLQWIRNRMLSGPGAPVLASKLFRFDTSDVSKWQENVLAPSVEIVEAFLKNSNGFDPKKFAHLSSGLPATEVNVNADRNLIDKWENFYCEVCEKTVYGSHEKEIHMNSKKHRAQVRRLERAPQVEKFKKMKQDKSDVI
jgi:tRNA dimethylallyltransferase